MRKRINIWALVLLTLSISACVQKAEPPAPPPETLELNAASFETLPGWGADDFRQFETALTRSCTRIAKRSPQKQFGPDERFGTYVSWQGACQKFWSLPNKTPEALKQFFETSFTPHQVLAGAKDQGLFTGYYEASLRGSKTRSPRYNIPLHTRPDDLIMVQLGDFRDDLKGRRIAGRVVNGKLKPYEPREDIVTGQWSHNDKVLIWVDSAVDAFFVQIQGSGIVELESGQTVRIGYAGQNGHPYYAIGRELIKRGALSKETVSMQSIRAWLEANPAQADEIMNTNASYVFFKELKNEGPVGGEGVALTPLRSLAIDHTKLPYGAPIWVDIKGPDLNRMMMTQDTGGAIRGAVRGDVFWGHGPQAETSAGHMKAQGRYWVMVPKAP